MTVHPGASPEAQGTAALGAATQEPAAAFTPGPWEADMLSDVHAEVRPHDDLTVIARITRIDTAANARLIAAAPELYEALRKIISNTLPGSYAEQTALAALAKAEGKP